AGTDGRFDPLGRRARLRALQPEPEQCRGDGSVVELKRAGQAQLDAAKIMKSELEIEMLRCRGWSLIVDGDLVTDEQRGAAAPAIILDEMRPQGSAVFTIDDGATAGAGVALVGCDQLKRVAEQFDMLVIDRG